MNEGTKDEKAVHHLVKIVPILGLLNFPTKIMLLPNDEKKKEQTNERAELTNRVFHVHLSRIECKY